MSTQFPTAEPKPRRTGAARAVAVAVGLFLAGFLANLAFGLAVALPLVFVGLALTGGAVLVALTAAGQLGFAAVGAVYLHRWLSGIPVRRPTRADLRTAGGYTVAVLLVAVAFTAVSQYLPIEPTSTVLSDAVVADPRLLVVFAVLSILLVAPAEELLFRGAIQGRLRRTFGPVAAVVGAGLLFAALHVLNFGTLNSGAAVALVAIFTVGCLLGWAYERTENLVVPVVIHALYNSVLFVGTYVVYLFTGSL
ncbi:CPBP family intramembrane glutamic endopeptidase [Halogeometricum limi]|uniref:CAAX prenyl protease 2/Lysostaphin resistance protein A-like domain-containing protein n=1 Tax=Halogeometricum limi TaxID=555875 RepID=A0A1I6G3D8_9EURY|nr:type II CAAX endopeptidase family protein [Halogeometricum limi]SFR36715.1 hypothetical protein SAMN04488124_0809 [Halogeometricum limi]